MKLIKQTITASLATLTLVLMTGCDTAGIHVTGPDLTGWIPKVTFPTVNVTPINVAPVWFGIAAPQQEQLQAVSPQTVVILQRNDQIAQQQAAASTPPPAGQPVPATAGQPVAATTPPAAPAEAPIPLKVTDITAMTAAGIKADAIIDAIKESKAAAYPQPDISAAQTATPPVDAKVIAFMKSPAA